MVVLSRKVGEKVLIDNAISVTVAEVSGNHVRLAFDAPDQVRILRAELACWQDEPTGRDQSPELAFVCEW
jgi:carbon storage regulator CsrA